MLKNKFTKLVLVAILIIPTLTPLTAIANSQTVDITPLRERPLVENIEDKIYEVDSYLAPQEDDENKSNPANLEESDNTEQTIEGEIDEAGSYPDSQDNVENESINKEDSNEQKVTEHIEQRDIHVEIPGHSWPQEDLNAFFMLMGDFRNLLDRVDSELNFTELIIHYYWLSGDTGVDLLEIALGLSLNQFTSEDIANLENVIYEFTKLYNIIRNVSGYVMDDTISFVEASIIVVETTNELRDLIAQTQELLPSIPTSWTTTEWEQIEALLEENHAVRYRYIDNMYAIQTALIMGVDLTQAPFNLNAEDYATILELIDEFIQLYGEFHSEIEWQLIGLTELALSFEEAKAAINTTTTEMLRLINLLQGFVGDQLGDDIWGGSAEWTDEELRTFRRLLRENDRAWENLYFSFDLPKHFDLTQAPFNLSPTAVATASELYSQFLNLPSPYSFSTAVHLRFLTFEEAYTLITEATAEFVRLLAELEAIFGVEPWSREERRTFRALVSESDALWERLDFELGFVASILHYHNLGQTTEHDLVYLIFLLTLSEEEITILENMLVTFTQLANDNWYLPALEGRTSFEAASAFVIANTEGMLAIVSQLEYLFGAVETAPPHPADDLRTFLMELGWLELNPDDFTPESWHVFSLALNAAFEVLALEIDDLALISIAYQNLRDAFNALVRVEEANIHTVTFNLNGGIGNFPAQNVRNGEFAIAPTDIPTKEGYTFIGWFTAKTGGATFMFNAPITSNTTIYARWSQNTQTPSTPPTTPDSDGNNLPQTGASTLNTASIGFGLISGATVITCFKKKKK